MAKQVKIKMTNIEANFLSDLVVNCKTPGQILRFTNFVEATITKSLSEYTKDVTRVTEAFKKDVEAQAELYLQKDETTGNFKEVNGQPVPQEGKEEDWVNVYTAAQNTMQNALNQFGNTPIEYTLDVEIFNDFVEMFKDGDISTYISLCEDPKQVTQSFVMIYLIIKRLNDAEIVKAKGDSK